MNFIEGYVFNKVMHYNPKKYWQMRNIVTDPNARLPKIIKLYYLFKIKRMEAFNNASLGTYLNRGANFKGVPVLPHGLRGIFITDKAFIGENATIFHQVTIGVSGLTADTAPVIGDNCFIGAGAKIIGSIKIGDNVKIGTNAVVTKDIPDGCTVVGFNKIINKTTKRITV
jgi:serine acetyltransferase